MRARRTAHPGAGRGRISAPPGARRAVGTAAACIALLTGAVTPAQAASDPGTPSPPSSPTAGPAPGTVRDSAPQQAPSSPAPARYRLPADASNAGSIVYIKNNNIFLSSPNMSTTVQVTRHGARQTPNHTGAGYASVSQANNGLIVAVRNQTAPTGEIYGWIWILDRRGDVLATFQPQQMRRADSIGCATAPFSEYPQGITHVSVSPNGKRIAYLQQVDFVNFNCSSAEFFYTYVADLNGSHAAQVTQNTDTGSTDIDFGQWTRNNQLLLDSTSSPNIDETAAMYYLNLPGRHARYWVGPTHFRDPDWINSYYQEPTVSHGRLASDGYAYDYGSTVGHQALVLWTSGGPPAIPRARCSVPVQATTDNASVAWPDWSPDGSSLVFTESDGVANQASEGIYLMGVGSLNRCAALDVPGLMVPGGSSPDWGPALPTQPYFTDVTPRSPFYGDIMWLGESGVTTGYADGSFRPTVAVSRQAMAAYLFRYGHRRSGDPVCQGRAPYPDVRRGSVFCGDIAWLKRTHTTTGYSDGGFHPTVAVSRQAMAAYLYRFTHDGSDAGRCRGTAPYPDVQRRSVFCGDIRWLKRTGITTGFPDGTFRPAVAVSRQAMAAYLHRLHRS